jgi:hypothetical protein
MENNQPILSCAGRNTVSIDAVLLQQLLQNYTPNLIGVKHRAGLLANAMYLIADGEYGDKSLDMFKDTINEEFLFIQLMEASRLARTVSAEALCDVPDSDNECSDL